MATDNETTAERCSGVICVWRQRALSVDGGLMQGVS